MKKSGKVTSTNLKRLVLWSPKVHEFYGETLFYFLISFGLFEKNTFKKIDTFLKKMGIDYYCLYAVLGAYDALLRVWLNQSQYSNLLTKFNDYQEIRIVSEFAVKDQKHWALEKKGMAIGKITDTDVGLKLAKYEEQELEDLQAGKNEKLLEELDKVGLLRDIKITWDEKYLKFYIAISEPNPIFSVLKSSIYSDILELLKSYEDNLNHVNNISIYQGLGVAWLLLKGVAKTQETLINLAMDLRSIVSRYDLNTTTFVLGKKYSESDYIQTDSLKGTYVTDRNIASWIPDFYSPGVSPINLKKQEEVEIYLRDKDYFRRLAKWPEKRNFLGRLATSIAKDELSPVTGSYSSSDLLSEWFRLLESSLREYKRALMVSLSQGDSKKEAKISKQLNIRKKQFLSLGDILTVIEKLFSLNKENKNFKIFKEIEDLVKLRNLVQHGDFSYLKDWKWTLEYVYKFEIFRPKLVKAVKSIIKEWKPDADIFDI